MISRRTLLKTVASLALAAKSSPAAASQGAGSTGKPQPFDFAWLKGQARWRAGNPYQEPKNAVPRSLTELDYDRFQSIRFRRNRTLWLGQDLDFQVRFFHLGRNYAHPVHMHEVVNGQARPIRYEPAPSLTEPWARATVTALASPRART